MCSVANWFRTYSNYTQTTIMHIVTLACFLGLHHVAERAEAYHNRDALVDHVLRGGGGGVAPQLVEMALELHVNPHTI